MIPAEDFKILSLSSLRSLRLIFGLPPLPSGVCDNTNLNALDLALALCANFRAGGSTLHLHCYTYC